MSLIPFNEGDFDQVQPRLIFRQLFLVCPSTKCLARLDPEIVSKSSKINFQVKKKLHSK